MKKFMFLILILFGMQSCISTRVSNFDNLIYDEKGNQIIFYTKLPESQYVEKGYIEIISVRNKSNSYFDKLKVIMKNNNYDAIISTQTQSLFSNLGVIYYRTTGVGVEYKK